MVAGCFVVRSGLMVDATRPIVISCSTSPCNVKVRHLFIDAETLPSSAALTTATRCMLPAARRCVSAQQLPTLDDAGASRHVGRRRRRRRCVCVTTTKPTTTTTITNRTSDNAHFALQHKVRAQHGTHRSIASPSHALPSTAFPSPRTLCLRRSPPSSPHSIHKILNTPLVTAEQACVSTTLPWQTHGRIGEFLSGGGGSKAYNILLIATQVRNHRKRWYPLLQCGNLINHLGWG